MAAATGVFADGAAGAVTFTPWPGSPFEVPAGQTPNSPSVGLDTVDLNVDPAPDLVAAVPESGGVMAFPAPTFGPRTFLGLGLTPKGSVAGDFDLDGRRDALVWGATDKAGGPTTITRGTTSGLASIPGPDYGFPARDVAVGDFTGDGRLDLFASEQSAVSVRVAKPGLVYSAVSGDGARTLATPDSGHIAAGDVTGDGKADLLFSQTTGVITIRTAPAFAAAGVATSVGTVQDLFMADVSGDARLEAVVLTPSEVKIFPITSAGQFGAPTTTATGVRITAKQSAVGDLDADGDSDVLLATTANDRVIAMLSNDNGTFAAPQPVLLPGGVRRGTVDAITTADFDRDGDRDIAVTSDGAYRVDVLINGVALPPIPTTGTPVDIAYETARATGTVNLRGIGGKVHFEYGETTAYGRSTPEEIITPVPSANQPVAAALDGLQPERQYHVRVVASNGGGTVAGADVAFTTAPAPVSDLAVSFTGPNLTISGAPKRFTSAVSGSFGPYTYAWNFGDGSPASGDSEVDHAFAPLQQNAGDAARIKPVGDASDAGEAGTRRGSYDVTLTVKDRFGRAATTTRPVTVIPNRAPVTSIVPLDTPLEYTEPALFTSGSHDPDSPLDRVVREDWDFGSGSIGTSAVTRDPGDPGKTKVCVPQPGTKKVLCVAPGLVPTPVSAAPWRDDRHGLAPIAKLEPVPNLVPKTTNWGLYNIQQAIADYALSLYPTSLCGAQTGSMTGCWPHKTVEHVKLHAVDRGGRDVTVEQDVPIRLRAQPAADVNLVTPGVDASAPGVGAGNTEQTGPIAAGRPDDPQNPGTPLTFDPGTTVIDSDEQPVWYSVQIGQPWQRSCKGKADITPDIPGPELTQPAKDVLTSLPPIDQLTGGDPNVLAQIELEGLGPQGVSLARRTSAAAKRFAPAVAVPGLGSGPVPVVSAPVKPKCVAGFGVKGVVSTVVSKNPKALTLTIPKIGEYSALLTVYDRTAATGKVRLDGIKVVAGQFKCSNTAQTMGKGANRFNWSGTCVDGNSDREVYWTKSPIDVNGVRFAPPEGSWMVVRKDDAQHGLVFTSSSVPKSSNPGDIKAWQPTGTAKKVSILIDDEPVASTSLQVAKDDPGVRLDRRIVESFDHTSQARYGGLPIATKVSIDLAAKCTTKQTDVGGSQVDFEVQLPSDFGAAEPGQAPVPASTKRVVIPGCNPLDKTVITKVTDTGNYKRVAGGVRGVTSWTSSKRPGKARRTIVGTPSPELNLSNIWLGPVYIENFNLRYDDASKTFTGSGAGELLSKKVTVRVVITNGSLTEAGGSVQADIQLGSTPLMLKRLGFKLIKKNGITLQGSAQVTTSDGVLLVANGVLELQTSPVKLTLDGDAGLAGGLLPLGKAHVEVGDGKALIAASTGNSIGPFSYAVNVSGAFSSSAFNVEGSGRACIFACLGINGVLSSRGIAVCGEIDLWVHTFRPGFGYLYEGKDLDGFVDGCGLGPYRAVVGRLPVSSGGKPQVSATKAELAVRATLTAGQTQPIEVEKDQRTLSLIARGQPGKPPSVTLTGPATDTCFGNKCAAAKVVRTPVAAAGQTLDNYGFDESTGSVVDVDRVKGEVRMVIANPRSGVWSLAADPGSETVTSVAYSRDRDLPKAKAFGASVTKVSAKDNLGTKTYGGLLTSTTQPVATAKRLTLGIGAKTVIKGARISQKAIGDAYKPLLRKVSLKASALPAGDTIAFVERGDGTAQSVASYVVPGTGKLTTEFAFLPAVGGTAQRHVDAYITSPNGIPRGVVHDIDTFKASPPPQPKAPRIASIKAAKAGKVRITVKDAPAYGLKSSMPLMQVVLRRKGGGVSVIKLVGTDFKKQGNTWVATVRAGSNAAGAKAQVRSITPTGTIAKGPGRKLTGTVKR